MTSNNNDTELLSVGQQCSESSCLLVDFLPFKCQHCTKSFCQEHFLVEAHHCPQYDETKHNRVAPSCPLCNTPVAIPPGEDPNIRMERHINSECSVMTGKSGKTRSQPVCARGKCGKVLYAPIGCTACKKQFCPQHRFPKDHSCSSLTSATPSSSSSSSKSNSMSSSKLFVKTSVAKASNAFNSRPHPLPSSSEAPSSSNIKALNNPFAKTDRTLASPTAASKSTSPIINTKPSPRRTPSSDSQIAKILDPLRAKAEKESRRKAMMERAKKGLLTEQEKLLLAEEEAERAKEVSSKTNKDCSIM